MCLDKKGLPTSAENKDVTKWDLAQVLNGDLLQSLMNDLYVFSGIPLGIIDTSGNIIVSVGWQEVCTKYHRVHPETCQNCIESDYELTKGIKPGEFRQYKCKNNMWDVATPIYIGGERKGHIFLGQFIYEDEHIDYTFFKEQANTYGFDEEAYLTALSKVPRFTRTKVKMVMRFYTKFAALIAELSYSNRQLESANHQLRENNEFTHTLLDAIPAPVFYKDLDMAYLGGNKAFDKVLGCSKEDYIGKHVKSLKKDIYTDTYDEADHKLLKSMGKQVYETSVVYADGSLHNVAFHKAVFKNSKSRAGGIIGVMLDITERKEYEEKLLLAQSELEEKVLDRTAELAEANQELFAINEELTTTLEDLQETQQKLIHSEKMASLGNLVAGFSHEISTPIGIGVTSISYLQRELKELKQKHAESKISKQYFELFLRDSEKAVSAAVSNLERADLLLKSLKQVTIDQAHDQWRSFQVKDYLNELVFSLDPLLKKKQCRLEITCPDSAKILGFPGVFAQIVTNFVVNSVNHAYPDQSGGVVKIQVRKEGPMNLLLYSDDGIGMTKEVRRRAFEPFFTTKRGVEGGTGLGLHLVYNLVVQKLGGEIQLRSEVDQGTHFIVKFPDYMPE